MNQSRDKYGDVSGRASEAKSSHDIVSPVETFVSGIKVK